MHYADKLLTPSSKKGRDWTRKGVARGRELTLDLRRRVVDAIEQGLSCRQAAERFWKGMRNGVASVEPVGGADLEAAWQIGLAFSDQDFSIVDRTSFAVMRRLGIERAASLDDDFAIFRFGPNRRRAFTIVR